MSSPAAAPILSFCEVVPDHTNPPASHRKDITLNTGASQSTLQDIKVAERAGGFCYANASASTATRNRFIHWRTQHDCVELLETSLDANLVDGHVCYRFADAPVLHVSVHETADRRLLVLLIATVGSVHRLSFAHPERLAAASRSRRDAGDEAQVSVFADASLQAARDPATFHVIGAGTAPGGGGNSGSSHVPHAATAWLPANGSHEALFALAYQTSLCLFSMHAETGQTIMTELKQHTIVPRIFSNITGALRGKPQNNDSQFVVSMVFGDVGTTHSVLYALYRDDQVRAWSTRGGQCVSTVNCVTTDSGGVGGVTGETRPQGPQQNILRRSTASTPNTTTLCAFLSHSMGAEFVTILCSPTSPSGNLADAAGLQMRRTHSIPAPPAADLIDYELTDDGRLWALWCSASGAFNLASFMVGASGAATGASLCWQPAHLDSAGGGAEQPPPALNGRDDPKDAYCAHIFYPGRYQRDCIAKALLMFGRTAPTVGNFSGSGGQRSASAVVANATAADAAALSAAQLRERCCVAIELEIAAEVGAYEADGGDALLGDDEALSELSARHWERFYACVEQYHVRQCQPVGLFGLGAGGAGVCVVRKRSISVLRTCEVLEHLWLTATADDDDDEAGVLENGAWMHNVAEALGAGGMADRANGQAADVVRLVRILAAVEAQLGDELRRDVDAWLGELQQPHVIVARLLASAELEESVFTRDFVQQVQQAVHAIGDLRAAMRLLLERLRMDCGDGGVEGDDADGGNAATAAEATDPFGVYRVPRQLLDAVGRLFGGDLGVSLLAESLRQGARVRFALCRNLLVLQQLLVERFALGSEVLEEVRSGCQPSTVVFVQAYYVMVWLCEVPLQSGYAAATLDHNIQRLNVLQISQASRRIIRPQQPITLLEFFLRSRGLQAGWTALVEADTAKEMTGSQQQLLPLIRSLSQLIWPISGSFILGEWLIASCQHIFIQEYVRLLASWCEWNSCSRHFILAVSLLETGEPAKAHDLFMHAAKGVLTEPFLVACILPAAASDQDDDGHIHQQEVATAACSDTEALTAYYLRIIQLFEQHGALDHVIRLAKAAIGCLAGGTVPAAASAVPTALQQQQQQQLAMFQSIVFASHLQLEHYDEAYHALIENADGARRKDCLRQLVGRLFERRRPDLLMRFPYVRLQPELEEIVEARARAEAVHGGDEPTNRYYDFLYSFHVTKGSMRRAAAIMYEQAMRLQVEGGGGGGGGGRPPGRGTEAADEDRGAQALQSRYECLLACQNALHLVDGRYAWLARPVLGDEMVEARAAAMGGGSSRDDEENASGMDMDTDGGLEEAATDDMNRLPPSHVRVLQLADIRLELHLCEAQLTLLRHRTDLRASACAHVRPEQIVAVLATSGLYTAAIKLARSLRGNGGQRQRQIAVVLEHLTMACVRADDAAATGGGGGGGATDETWQWLRENDLADVPHRNGAAEMAWLLLRQLLEANEDDEDEGNGEEANGIGNDEQLQRQLYLDGESAYGTGATAATTYQQPHHQYHQTTASASTGTLLHRAVTHKLIAAGVFLPHWLQRSYQRRRPSELLLLLVRAGRLVEAAQLASEYVWAMMMSEGGGGGGDFGLRHSLHSTKGPLCFPVTAVDELLLALEANAAEEECGGEYAECWRELSAVVDRYVETVARVSANRVEYGRGTSAAAM